MISETEGTKTFAGDKAMGESRLFATFLRSKRRETATCEHGSDISGIFLSNGSFFTPDTVRHFSQRLWRALSLMDPLSSSAPQKYQRKLTDYLRYFSFYLRKSTFHLRNWSGPGFLFAIYPPYVRTVVYKCGIRIILAILSRIKIRPQHPK